MRKNSVKLYAARLIILGVNFLSLLIAAFVLGPAQFGEFVRYWSYSSVLASVISFGAPVYLLRAFSLGSRGGSEGVSRVQAFNFILIYPISAITLIYLASMAAKYNFPKVFTLNEEPIVSILAMALSLHVISCASSALRMQDWPTFSMASRDGLPGALIIIASIAVSFQNEQSVNAVVKLLSMSLMFVSCALLMVMLERSRRHPIFRTAGRGIGYQLSYWGNATIGTVWAQIDIVVISTLAPGATVGIYTIMRRIANLAAMPVSIATWIIVKKVGESYHEGSREGIQQASNEGLRITLAPALFLMLASVAAIPLVFHIYNIDLKVINFAPYLLLLVCSMISVYFATSTTVASLCGLENYALAARLCGILTFIVCVAILGEKVSLVEVAASITISNLLMNYICWRSVKEHANINTSLSAILNRSSLKE